MSSNPSVLGGQQPPPPNTPSFTRPPAIHFAIAEVGPPSTLYINRDDVLLLRVVSASASQVVEFRGRLLLADGKIVAFRETVSCTAARGSAGITATMAEGFLLSLVAIPSNPAPIGHTFVSAYILRTGALITTVSQQLFAGYTTGLVPIGWPGATNKLTCEGNGNIRSITGTVPSAGAEISETVPAGARWRLKALHFRLTASATVTNRTPCVLIDDGTNILIRSASNYTEVANEVSNYTAAPGMSQNSELNESLVIKLPVDVMLLAGYRMRTTTLNIQVGDQYTAPQYLVEEWMDLDV